MTRASRPRLHVLVVERLVLGVWSVVEALAEVTVTVVEARAARQRAVRPRATRPSSPVAVGHEAAAGAWTQTAPCAALTARSSTVGGSLRV